MPKVPAAYRDARRREILTAARVLFAEKGFASTSMADIAVAAGLATGTLYRYFPSKDDLVIASFQDESGRGIEGPAVVATETLRRSVDPRADGMGQARLMAQLWGEAAVDSRLASVVTGRHAEMRDILAGLVERDRAEGAGDGLPSRDLAEVALAALLGYSVLVAADAPVDHDGFAGVLAELLGRALSR